MVKIVTGAIGSGKTQYCIDDIKAMQSREPQRRCVMLVPSHYSHEAEKLMTDVFGGTGLNNIEVTSFEKLAREMLDGTERRLAAAGKQAVICRAVERTAAELSGRSDFDGKLVAAVGRADFIDIARSLISELHRYMVTGDMLREGAARLDDGALKQKLLITAMLSDNYENILKDTEYIDSDEDLLRLAAVLGSRFCDARIYIDRFDELLPQQLQVLRVIIDSGADITITFNTAPDATYYGTTLAIGQIRAYTEVQTVHLDGSMKHIKNAPELKFLFDTWGDMSEYTGDVNAVSVFEARDAYTETEHIARRILDLVREDGYRFRDIAIICGDADSYEHIIEAVFDEYGIPYYSDQRYTVSEHPIAVQILSLLDIIENDWDYESVFAYLRAGFVYMKQDNKYRRISSNDIDRLENYILKRGIRGRNAWSRSWTDDRSVLDRALDRKPNTNETELAELDAIREAVVAPVIAYSDAAKQARTVTERCVALYEFLESINLYEGLRAELLGMAVNRATADAQRLGQMIR